MSRLLEKRVLVTRPAHQADNLCRMIEHLGGIPVRLPTIEIVANTEFFKIGSVLKKIKSFQWCVFISANAVNFALAAFNGKIDRLDGVRIAAIGRATAKALEVNGLPVDLVPARGQDSEALLATPEMQKIEGQRILIVRGFGGREELADGLRKRGAEIEYLEIYRRVIPNIDCSSVAKMLNRNQLDVVTVTSGEALHNLLALLGKACHAQLTALPLVVISERMAHIAVDSGFKRIMVADSPADSSILETIIMCTTR